jgi:uncharacterized protein (TIGR03086 family)
MLDLGPATDEVTRLLGGVRDDQLSSPTPCAGTTVAALLDHFLGLSLAFTWAATKSTPAGRSAAPGFDQTAAERLDPQWRALLPRRLAELAEAWRVPEAWQGAAEAGGVTMPSAQLGVVALDEVVLHGWDLARATGQPFTCDPVSTAAVLRFTTAAADPAQAGLVDGVFGPPVDVPLDAPPLDRALGFAGRDPGWTPA